MHSSNHEICFHTHQTDKRQSMALQSTKKLWSKRNFCQLWEQVWIGTTTLEINLAIPSHAKDAHSCEASIYLSQIQTLEKFLHMRVICNRNSRQQQWKWLKYLSIVQHLSKWGCMHTVDYDMAMNMSKMPPHTSTGRNFRNLSLNLKSITLKNVPCMFSFI